MSKIVIALCFTITLFALNQVRGASDWLSAPKPKFPPRPLEQGSEGSVKLRLLLAKDGTVTSAKILKPSGNALLDETARNQVLKWRLKPSAIKPSDLTKGRDEVIEFRQEALVAATYPLGVKAAFSNEQTWKPWMYAPFPYYPLDARRLRRTGTVVLSAKIGNDGSVVKVQVIKSSGFSELDQQAIIAVRHWRAHKEYAGQDLRFPISFRLARH